PGQRIYLGKSKIKSVKNNYGIAIYSTSRGLMTNKEARKNNIGGELICEIY
ncbi:30S ribosomal protein S8, partial [Candidatus Peregrinibacteria bacterium RIFOXYA2_FULL_33_7]